MLKEMSSVPQAHVPYYKTKLYFVMKVKSVGLSKSSSMVGLSVLQLLQL